MNKIKVMDSSLANKIAAGEVVESCASVVKELVENAIDASSDEIKISLLEVGLKDIQVVDNGTGMNEQDALIAFERHATSKISKEDDLYFINTLGFRGEALASIASVSMVNIKTCEKDIGTEINIQGGKFIDKIKCEARKGTNISIKNLFYNTPARLKYLKGPKEELAMITSYIEKLSLSKPNIRFTLLNNNKKILQTTGSRDLLKTIFELYGHNISSNMMKISGSNDDYDIYGYVCKPSVLKSNRNHMITIVNGRTVKNNELNRAINDAYYTYKPDNKYPIVVLNINADPTLIDVNIHPTKQDIKFSKFSELCSLVTDTIKNVLFDSNLIPSICSEEEIPKEIKVAEEQVKFAFSDERKTIVEDKTDIGLDQLRIYPVGLLLGTYIACQNEDGIYLIDQHAAQERINYEKNMRALTAGEIHSISMLIPITIELPKSEFLIIKDYFSLLNNMGFDVEEFGINTLIFKSNPTWLRNGYEEESIYKIIDLIVDMKDKFDMVKFRENVAITLACKLSIKANYEISLEEMEVLVNELLKCDNPHNCPHGRPTIIKFSTYDLEKMFKRVMN